MPDDYLARMLEIQSNTPIGNVGRLNPGQPPVPPRAALQQSGFHTLGGPQVSSRDVASSSDIRHMIEHGIGPGVADEPFGRPRQKMPDLGPTKPGHKWAKTIFNTWVEVPTAEISKEWTTAPDQPYAKAQPAPDMSTSASSTQPKHDPSKKTIRINLPDKPGAFNIKQGGFLRTGNTYTGPRLPKGALGPAGVAGGVLFAAAMADDPVEGAYGALKEIAVGGLGTILNEMEQHTGVVPPGPAGVSYSGLFGTPAGTVDSEQSLGITTTGNRPPSIVAHDLSGPRGPAGASGPRGPTGAPGASGKPGIYTSDQSDEKDVLKTPLHDSAKQDITERYQEALGNLEEAGATKQQAKWFFSASYEERQKVLNKAAVQLEAEQNAFLSPALKPSLDMLHGLINAEGDVTMMDLDAIREQKKSQTPRVPGIPISSPPSHYEADMEIEMKMYADTAGQNKRTIFNNDISERSPLDNPETMFEGQMRVSDPNPNPQSDFKQHQKNIGRLIALGIKGMMEKSKEDKNNVEEPVAGGHDIKPGGPDKPLDTSLISEITDIKGLEGKDKKLIKDLEEHVGGPLGPGQVKVTGTNMIRDMIKETGGLVRVGLGTDLGIGDVTLNTETNEITVPLNRGPDKTRDQDSPLRRGRKPGKELGPYNVPISPAQKVNLGRNPDKIPSEVTFGMNDEGNIDYSTDDDKKDLNPFNMDILKGVQESDDGTIATKGIGSLDHFNELNEDLIEKGEDQSLRGDRHLAESGPALDNLLGEKLTDLIDKAKAGKLKKTDILKYLTADRDLRGSTIKAGLEGAKAGAKEFMENTPGLLDAGKTAHEKATDLASSALNTTPSLWELGKTDIGSFFGIKTPKLFQTPTDKTPKENLDNIGKTFKEQQRMNPNREFETPYKPKTTIKEIGDVAKRAAMDRALKEMGEHAGEYLQSEVGRKALGRLFKTMTYHKLAGGFMKIGGGVNQGRGMAGQWLNDIIANKTRNSLMGTTDDIGSELAERLNANLMGDPFSYDPVTYNEDTGQLTGGKLTSKPISMTIIYKNPQTGETYSYDPLGNPPKLPFGVNRK